MNYDEMENGKFIENPLQKADFSMATKYINAHLNYKSRDWKFFIMKSQSKLKKLET